MTQNHGNLHILVEEHNGIEVSHIDFDEFIEMSEAEELIDIEIERRNRVRSYRAARNSPEWL